MENVSELSARVDRQIGLVYQERIEDMRVFIGGSGPIIDFLVTHLAFLGFGTSQGFIGFYKNRKVKEEDIKGQLLLKETDLGKPLWEMIRKRVSKAIAADIRIVGIEDLDAYNYDAVVAVRSANSDSNDEMKLPSAETPIWAVSTKTAAYMGAEKPVYDQSSFDILTPSLAAVAAGFAVTEIMRRNQLIRPSEILSQDLNMRYIVQQPGILEKCKKAQKTRDRLPFKIRMKIGGETLVADYEEYTETVYHYAEGERIEEVVVDPDRVILNCRFPKESFLTRMLFDQIEVLDDISQEIFSPTDSLLFSPIEGTQIEHVENSIHIMDKDVDIPTELHDKTVFFLGVGGIGSWSTVLFNLSNTENCTLILNDHDQEVEEHNLNRQILFSHEEIGQPKALAGRRKLREVNPTNEIISLPWQTEIGVANALVMNDLLSLEEYEKRKNDSTMIEVDGVQIPSEIVREESVIAHALSNSDILICGPDNIRTRYISTVIGKKQGIPVISAAAERFEGKVDLFLPDGDCYVCRYGEQTKEQREVVSCTGKIPIPSIVSTIGTIGAMQTAVAIACLAEIEKRITHYVQYYPRYQLLAKCLSGSGCRHQVKEDCPEHLNLPLSDNPILFFERDNVNNRQDLEK
ncbi:MAG: ThiF family adenylyltransferase [Candidatus Thorarchaeota archaeon]|nr:ThiF family adenylyltransferase [Candidatus Thorarchaeota archaeon]